MSSRVGQRIFLGFGLVLLVVLGMGTWSLRATRQLREVTSALLTQTVPAIRLEVSLRQQIPVLMRHEGRAVVLADPIYRTLHTNAAENFERRLEALASILRSHDGQETLAQVRERFAEYRKVVEAEWAAVGRGAREQGLSLSRGAARQAADALVASVEALLAGSLAEADLQAARVHALERQAGLVTAFGLGLSLAVGLGLATLVAIRVGRPVRALCHATQLIAQGQYDAPLPVAQGDEVGELARHFRDMTAKLRELEKLKQEAFFSICHEFRTPLTSLTTATTLLETGALTEKQRRWLEIIRLDSDKLLRLTNQILDVAKLRSGMLPLDLKLTNLRELVDSATTELRPVIDAKALTLMVALPDPTQAVLCDPLRMQQVLTNLLANAVKFTPSGGHIAVRAQEDNGAVVLTVADTGPGIPATHLPHVFERYHRAHPRREGTGLGLAIVKGIVDAHGGRVWAESQEGQGTTFHVALPATAATS